MNRTSWIILVVSVVVIIATILLMNNKNKTTTTNGTNGTNNGSTPINDEPAPRPSVEEPAGGEVPIQGRM